MRIEEETTGSKYEEAEDTVLHLLAQYPTWVRIRYVTTFYAPVHK